jgi:hypothetical protein
MPAKKKTKVTRLKPVKLEKKKKKHDNTLFITASIIFLILLTMLIYRKVYTPRIVDVFACSDFCPGPQDQYEMSVYEGVSSKTQCMLIGGKFATIKGWADRNICLVQ